MTLRTVHVGVGGRGAWPIDRMAGDARFVPTALVDVNRDFLDAARMKLALPESHVFTDLTAALRSVESEAVVICTPTRTHAALCRLAFAAGKHVLVEKGMTMDYGEARALVREADAAGVKFCVAQNYRYQPRELTIRSLLTDAEHPQHPGDVRIADYICHRYRPEPRTLDYPFAMVWDMSCHHVDSLSCWLGPARRVTAHTYNTPWSRYTHDANIVAWIEYDSGAVCHYVLTHSATVSDCRLILQGSSGALRAFDVDGVMFASRPQRQLGASDWQPCILVDAPPSEVGVLNAFHNYITTGTEPGISGRNNLETLVVCEMLVRSAREHRPVERTELP